MRATTGSERRNIARWSLCAALVLFAHVGGAAALLRQSSPPLPVEAASGGFVVELAPTAAMQADRPPDAAPGPDQVQAEASPDTKEVMKEKAEETQSPPDLPMAPLPEVPGRRITLPRPPEKKAPQTPELAQAAAQPQAAVAATTSAQVVADRVAAVAAAPMQGAPGKPRSDAVPTWQIKVVGQIGRQQRYPPGARARHEQGVAHLVFTIDRSGRLLDSRVVESSGSPLLDAEALAMLRRAQPFPAPPSELPGEQIVLPVPINFSLR